jgi:hypothetical protein
MLSTQKGHHTSMPFRKMQWHVHTMQLAVSQLIYRAIVTCKRQATSNLHAVLRYRNHDSDVTAHGSFPSAISALFVAFGLC